MALYTVKGASNIPEGAVRVSKEKALAYQKQVVRDWERESEVYGSHIASGLAVLSSVLVIKHFKAQFQLGSRLMLATYAPTSAISAYFSYTKFNNTVTNNTLIMKIKCPICTQIRHVCQQVLVSMAYPTVISCAFFSYMAIKLNTLHVPDIKTEYKEYFRLMFKFTKAGTLKFQALITVHILVAMFLPYMQGSELANITKTLRELEEREAYAV